MNSLAPIKPGAGRLLLVPNTLDHANEPVSIEEALPRGVLLHAARLQHWVVEDARSARAFLKRVDAVVPLAQALQTLDIKELPQPRKGSREPVPEAQWQQLLSPALAGHDIGLLSEAGLPAVADPGAALVAAAHMAGVEVTPLAGPSSLLLALSASGLNGQSFAFAGYLPQDAEGRSKRLRELEALSRREHQTQLLIETPYRNPVLTKAMLETLHPTTRLSISSGLTLPGGWSRCQTVQRWRRSPPQVSDRVPAVFALLAA